MRVQRVQNLPQNLRCHRRQCNEDALQPHRAKTSYEQSCVWTCKRYKNVKYVFVLCSHAQTL